MAKLYWRIKDKNGDWKFVAHSVYCFTVEEYGLPNCKENVSWRYREQDVVCHCDRCVDEYQAWLEEEE